MSSPPPQNSTTLFACSRCYSRHPFEDLSAGQQLCKTCRTTYPYCKCTYCRTEFQQTSKSTTHPTCAKCSSNVKTYGKPQSCVYCNIIAAFIGNKCQRCTNSEKKYGLPVGCEQCKMQCAFDRGEEDKKVDGKLLCWLCTLSYKRALAKTKSSEKIGSAGGGGGMRKRKHPHHHHTHHSTSHSQPPNSSTNPTHSLTSTHHGHTHSSTHANQQDKRPHRPDVTKLSHDVPTSSSPPPQVTKKEGKLMVLSEEHNCSDHMVALTQLKEQIAGLTRQVALKDRELLAKDRQITDLKATNFTTENELRSKLNAAQRDHDAKVQNMSAKLKALQKELAAKSKLVNNNNKISDRADRDRDRNTKSSLTIVGRALKEETKSDSDEDEKSGCARKSDED